MPDFGFSMHAPRHIDLDTSHRDVFDFVKANEPSIQRCIYCGACGATCTAGSFAQISLRKINLLLLRGQTDEVRNMVNTCLLCGKCLLVCPRNVNTRRIILLVYKALKTTLS
ncbi:MAG: 4Fe-4S dicluster domain-containing protein [Bacteroidales bacterium]